MWKSSRTGARVRVVKAGHSDQQLVKDQERERQLRDAHIARLRTLRLAKAEVDRQVAAAGPSGAK